MFHLPHKRRSTIPSIGSRSKYPHGTFETNQPTVLWEIQFSMVCLRSWFSRIIRLGAVAAKIIFLGPRLGPIFDKLQREILLFNLNLFTIAVLYLFLGNKKIAARPIKSKNHQNEHDTSHYLGVLEARISA